MASVTLKSDKARPIQCGHPWIFSRAIARTKGLDDTDLVRVKADGGQTLGWGLYSPNSQIRVRMLDVEPDFEGPLDAAALEAAIRRCVARRARMGLPGEQTDAFRLVNSEGDGLPGLMVDVFPKLVVIQLTTLPMVRRREEVVAAVRAVFPDAAIREVPAPEAIASIEGFEVFDGWHGTDKPESVQFRENGVRYEMRPDTIQKTGHYADMRIHRRWIAERAAGLRVLDAYAYTGGFGLNAAAGGAAEVVCVDSSAPAIESAEQNARLNAFEQIETQRSKVDDYLRSCFDRGVRFDLIVLDPPKLAASHKHVKKALKVYESMTVQALRVLDPGGILALGSCSEAIGLPELERVLSVSSGRTERPLAIVYTGTQSPDHPYPAAMSEGRYLTFVGCLAR